MTHENKDKTEQAKLPPDWQKLLDAKYRSWTASVLQRGYLGRRRELVLMPAAARLLALLGKKRGPSAT